MITKEEIESLGWISTKDYTHIGEGWVFQLFSGDGILDPWYEMHYNPEDNRMRVERWVMTTETLGSPSTILECKIESLKELKQEISWCEIPIKQ